MRRLDELVADAGDRLSRIGADAVDSDDATRAGWATSRALGFLEACTVYDPEHADQLIVAFEPLLSEIDGVVMRLPDPAG